MKNFFTLRVVKLWDVLPHHWKHSRSGWMVFWATWSCSKCPCLLQRDWARWPLKVPFNPNHSM